MINSEKFAVDADYRRQEFQTCNEDRPVVAHFSANNPCVLLAAAKFVEKSCDAIDLNLGCPQRIAFTGHFGSYLLDDADRPLVLDIVRTLARNLSIPIFVKIRLLNTLPETITLCRQLKEAGAALIAIHGRYRVNLVGRTGPGARDGPAHLDQIAAVVKEMGSEIPIIANGNVITWQDVVANQQLTGAAGIMSAEGLLDNPALFNGGVAVDKLQLAEEYLQLTRRYPVKLKSVVFHVRRMCKDELTKYQLLEDCLTATSQEQVEEIVQRCRKYQRDPGSFRFDKDKERSLKEALERKKREEGKRKAFEERMVRKAKREKKDLNFYLMQGAQVPTEEEVADLRAMPKEEGFAVWKQKFSQHCYAFHFDPINRCPRDRTCSFLHMDASTINNSQTGEDSLVCG